MPCALIRRTSKKRITKSKGWERSMRKQEAVFTVAWRSRTLQQADTLFDHARQLSSRPKVSQPPEAQDRAIANGASRQPWGLGKLCEELCTNPYWNATCGWCRKSTFASSLLILFWGRYSIGANILVQYLDAIARKSQSHMRRVKRRSKISVHWEYSIRNTVKLLEASDVVA